MHPTEVAAQSQLARIGHPLVDRHQTRAVLDGELAQFLAAVLTQLPFVQQVRDHELSMECQ